MQGVRLNLRRFTELCARLHPHHVRENVMRKWLICLLLLAGTDGVQAQTWPSRPVKLIVSQAAGSPPDIACRIIAERLSEAFGRQFFVENRPGSGNIIGAQAAARSDPDG